jgi:hypothetical protein
MTQVNLFDKMLLQNFRKPIFSITFMDTFDLKSRLFCLDFRNEGIQIVNFKFFPVFRDLVHVQDIFLYNFNHHHILCKKLNCSIINIILNVISIKTGKQD